MTPPMLNSLVSQVLQSPPIWREGRTGLELATLLRDPVFRKLDGVPEGDGRPVLLLPGFLAGDNSLGVMTGWLRRAGFRTSSAGLRSNVDCSAATLERIEPRLERLVDRQGAPATIIGQSRGGCFARALAVRRPDLVASVVTLGSPLLSQLDVHPLVTLQVGFVGALGTFGVPGLFSASCLSGDCCDDYRAAVEAPFPEGIRYVAVYSRSDGVVRWKSCLDSAADCVEVRASHIGMAVNAPTYRAIASALRSAEAATGDDPALSLAA